MALVKKKPSVICSLVLLLLLVGSIPLPSNGFSLRPFTFTFNRRYKRIRFPPSGGEIIIESTHQQQQRVNIPTIASLTRTQASTATAIPDNNNNNDHENNNEKQKSERQEKFRRAGMAAALFSTYFTVMGAKCALPSVLSLLTSDSGLSFAGFVSKPQVLMAQQLTISTMAVAAGKLLLGPVIDRFGGALCLQVCLILLTILLATIATCNHFWVFAVAWVFVDFVFSSCWAGCINAVHHSFPQSEWAQRIAMIAAAARTGNAAAFALFGHVLQSSNSWRTVFWVSSFLQFIPISLLTYFGGRTPALEQTEVGPSNESKNAIPPKKKPSAAISTPLATLGKEAKTIEFWLHLTNRSALMVFGSFLLFVPTLMSQIYGLSSHRAAQVGSVFALGCLLSVTGGARPYAKLGKRNKIATSIILMGIATLCSGLQLGHMKGIWSIPASVSAASMFLWGFSFSIPFYIPGSMYALARGGKESSATIADVFDFGGFALLAAFNGYVAKIAAYSNLATAWIPTFQILTGCSLASMVSLALAIFFE